MPKLGPGASKEAKKERIHEEMGKFKRGTLHSGSKKGPTVKSRDQAIAISLSEAGLSRKDKRKGSRAQKGRRASGRR
jgi:hypothetical protein